MIKRFLLFSTAVGLVVMLAFLILTSIGRAIYDHHHRDGRVELVHTNFP